MVAIKAQKIKMLFPTNLKIRDFAYLVVLEGMKSCVILVQRFKFIM